MGKYEKPVVMEKAELAEGVFLASGGNGLDVKIEVVEQGFTIVHVTFTNKGSEDYNLNKFILTFNKDVSFNTDPQASNISATCSGREIIGIPNDSVIWAGDSYTYIAHLGQTGLVLQSYQINP